MYPALAIEEQIAAKKEADRMIRKHGYWMAMYHCTTLMIHCRKVKKGRHQSTDWEFWQEVRRIVDTTRR